MLNIQACSGYSHTRQNKSATLLILERKSLPPTKRYWLTLGVPERGPIMLMKRLPGARRSIRKAVISRLYLWDKSPGRARLRLSGEFDYFSSDGQDCTVLFTPKCCWLVKAASTFSSTFQRQLWYELMYLSHYRADLPWAFVRPLETQFYACSLPLPLTLPVGSPSTSKWRFGIFSAQLSCIEGASNATTPHLCKYECLKCFLSLHKMEW